MFDPLPSLYWHTLKDNSFVECFKNNEVNINTKKAEVSTGTKNWKIMLKRSNLEELISLEDYVFWETYFPDIKGTKVELAKKLDSSDHLYFFRKGRRLCQCKE